MQLALDLSAAPPAIVPRTVRRQLLLAWASECWMDEEEFVHFAVSRRLGTADDARADLAALADGRLLEHRGWLGGGDEYRLPAYLSHEQRLERLRLLDDLGLRCLIGHRVSDGWPVVSLPGGPALLGSTEALEPWMPTLPDRAGWTGCSSWQLPPADPWLCRVLSGWMADRGWVGAVELLEWLDGQRAADATAALLRLVREGKVEHRAAEHGWPLAHEWRLM